MFRHYCSTRSQGVQCDASSNQIKQLTVSMTSELAELLETDQVSICNHVIQNHDFRQS